MLPQVMFPMQLSYVGYPVGSIFLSMSLSMSVGILGSVEKENKNKK